MFQGVKRQKSKSKVN